MPFVCQRRVVLVAVAQDLRQRRVVLVLVRRLWRALPALLLFRQSLHQWWRVVLVLVWRLPRALPAAVFGQVFQGHNPIVRFLFLN